MNRCRPSGNGENDDGLRSSDGEAVVGQAQVADDLRAEQAVDVGGRGDLEAGEGFLGDAGAADDVAAFQHEHFPLGPGQIAGGHQAVVAAADDDRVVRSRHVR